MIPLTGRSAIVLGAGSAGLTAATLLQGAGADVTVVERTADVGGLAHTFEHGGFRLDYGPHAFHSKADEADRLFTEFAPKGYAPIRMRARLRLGGQQFDYPLRFGTAMLRLPVSTTFRMIRDYLAALVRRTMTEPPEDSFEAWGVKRYGRTMYELAFGGYSRRVWGMPTTQLSARLAEQKLPDLSFFELLRETFGGRGAKQKILYSSYLYPRGGVGVVFDAMASALRCHGGRILFGTHATEIRHDGARVKEVVVSSNGQKQTLGCDVLISTIPIPAVVNALRPAPPPSQVEAAGRLIYRSLVLVMVVVERPNVTGEMMVYLLDPGFHSNRVGEQKNLDPSMIPLQQTVLCFEFCVNERSPDWDLPDYHFFSLAREDLRRLGVAEDDEISGYFVRRLPEAYPIYDLHFHEHLTPALEALTSLDNLVPLGRQGLFIHNDIHDSMMMAIEGVKHVLSGAAKEAWQQRVKGFLSWRLR